MRIVPGELDPDTDTESVIETVALAPEIIDRVNDFVAREHPGMPAEFALPHLVRTMIDRLISRNGERREAQEDLPGDEPG